jgi:hypothetical protein
MIWRLSIKDVYVHLHIPRPTSKSPIEEFLKLAASRIGRRYSRAAEKRSYFQLEVSTDLAINSNWINLTTTQQDVVCTYTRTAI